MPPVLHLVDHVTNFLGIIYPFIHLWAKGVTHNSPTTYQLFPSEEYLKLMPSLYKEDIPNPVTTASEYYKVLNKSSNINSNLTNGNNRSHSYFRNTVLNGDIVSELQQVDTVVIGSSYGNLTPAIAQYGETLLGNSIYEDVIYKKDGDGTVMGVSAFATNIAGQHILPYKDFKNVTHGGLASEKEPLDYICNLIKGTATAEMQNKHQTSDKAGMSDYVKFMFQSKTAFNVSVYNSVGEKMDIRTANGDIRYMDLAQEENDYRALLYVPNSGYKVELSNTEEKTGQIDVSSTVTTLDYDGYNTASATYNSLDMTNSDKLVFDMTKKKVDSDSLGLLIPDKNVEVEKHNTSWNIESTITFDQIGDTKKIAMTGSAIDSGDITYNSLKWFSSDTAVAEISNDGMITAHGKGKALISAVQEGTNKVMTCEVTVKLNATSIAFKNIEMKVGDKTKIKPTFDSDAVTEREIKYSYDKEGIVEIDHYGIVTAIKAGEVTVTGTAPGGATGTFTIKVYNGELNSVQAITVSPTIMTVPIGTTETLTANIYPETAENTGVRWNIDDDSIASIESDGLSCKITGLKKGSTTVTVVSLDGGFTATSRITVEDRSNIILNGIDNSVIQVRDMEGKVYAEITGEISKGFYLDPKKVYIVEIKVAEGIGYNIEYNGVKNVLSSLNIFYIELREDRVNTFTLIR